MLTIFTHCKAFEGHIATIQRNAIGSWMRLRPRCDILLCGNRDGTAETAKEFGLRHVPDILVNEYGTPLVSDLFAKAKRLAAHDVLCYVNCDILLMSDFLQAVATVAQRKKRFLMVGECWNLDLDEPLAFDRPTWQEDLRRVVRERGKPRGPQSIDFFVFSRGLYGSLPPFVLGTAYFDNWLIWKARSLRAATVDTTLVTLPVHQNHDYAHITGGYMFTRQGENARRNLELAGGLRHIYWIFDTTYRLDRTGLRRNLGGYLRLKYRWDYQLMDSWLVRFTRPIRHLLGLRKARLERFAAHVTRER